MLLFTLVNTGATNRLDEAIYDFSLRLTHFKPRPDIVIVAIDAKSLEEKGEWPWSRLLDAELISRIAQDHPKALGCMFLFVSPGPPGEDEVLRRAISLTKTFLPTPRDPAHPERPWLTYKPVPILAAAAAGLGPGDPDADEHAVVRRVFLLQGPKERLTPQIILQMARLSGRRLTIDDKGRPVGEGPDALFRAGEMLIPYRGAPGTYTEVSAASVLNGNVNPGLFTNKFVLLGPTAPGLLDDYQTPISADKGMPNVEIEANVLDALLSRVRIIEINEFSIFIISIILIVLLLIGLVRLGPRDSLWLAVVMAGAPLMVSILGVAFRMIWLPPTPYLATLAIIVPYWGWRRLNAASVYFSDQIRELQRDSGGAVATPRALTALGGDVVLQQITLLEDAKRRIADLRRFVDDILSNFPDPVLVVDRDGVIARVNAAAASFAGRIGVTVTAGARIEPVLATIITSDPNSHPVWPPEATAAGDAEGMADIRPLTGEGPEGRTYELRFTPTTGAQDQPTGWIVHLADVTTLVAAMRQREEALQLLSHDMRSPQAAILAILGHPDFEDAPAVLRQRIEGQARRTLELADSFVRLAQAESARYNFELIDLAHIVRDAVDAVWGLSQSAGVKVLFDPDDVEYVVLADRRLLTRALINLLDNAIKFSPRDKTVTCRLTPDQLEGASAVACEIADSAGGMAQAQLADLFHRFATSREDVTGSQGVGLGLALVHTVVTRHHGVIRCESARGEGTVFTLTLPLDETAEVGNLAEAEA